MPFEGGGNPLTVTQEAAVESAGNSTTTPLGANATFTGEWADIGRFASISILAKSDAAGTLYADASTDGETVFSTTQLSDGSSGAFGLQTLIALSRYFRVRVVNGAVPQGSFVLQTIFNQNPRVAIPTSRMAGPLSAYTPVLNVRGVLAAQQPGGAFVPLQADESGVLEVSVVNPTTAFGETRVAHLNPIVQIDATYGLQRNVETFTAASGAATASNGNFYVATGTSVGGYGVIRSTRAIRYRAGEASAFRFTAIFDPTHDVANSLQLAGAFNSAAGFFVGYHNAQGFGVMHRTGGAHEIRLLTISVASNAGTNVTLTLNGVAYVIPVTSAAAAVNAYEIATWLNANQAIWEAYQNASTVVLFGRDVGPKAGVYSATAAAGAFTGVITQLAAGVVNTETWTAQADFNIDTLDGTGPSGMDINTATGNVFAIDMQYLGYGAVGMFVENPTTGKPFAFHVFQFSNARTLPTLTNPTLKIGWVAASLGSTTAITVAGASAMGGVEGLLHPLRRPRGYSFQRGAVGATLTSLFAVRVRSVFANTVQLSEMLPRIVYVSPEGTKACEIKLLLNPTFASATNWTYIDATYSIVEVDTTGTTFSATGTEVVSFVVAGGLQGSFQFATLAEDGINPMYLQRGDVLVIAARITGGAGNNVTASLTWIED